MLPFLRRLVLPLVRRYEAFITDRFHHLYYWGPVGRGMIFPSTRWLDVACLKCPLDMWMYQEIIHELKPDLIVETGTYMGGSALFMASILDSLDKGAIVTIDIASQPRTAHPRIQYVTGSSTDEDLIRSVLEPYKRDVCLVILDSDHTMPHVRREIELLAPYVTLGSYLIVEDTNINGHPTFRRFGPGPYEAVAEFIRRTADFVVDRSREKYLLTFNPSGFLKRVK